MKKLLTLAAAGLVCVAGYAQSQTLVAEDRTPWTIKGCAEHNSNGDGGFNDIKDDNPSTFWHSTWSSVTGHNRTAPHYFVIDRSENNSDVTIDGFGYMPRQDNGNGRATTWRIFFLDNITNLKTTGPSTTEGHIDDNHASLTTFLTGKTPVASGSFSYTNANDNATKKVFFNSGQTGRYVLFVIDAATTTNDATCAEFYLYQKGSVLNFKRKDNSLAFSCVTTLLADGSNITCPTEIGSGSGTVSNGTTTIDITLNDNIAPFKLVSARYQNQWAKSFADGMASTANAGSYDDGSWYLEVPQTDGTIKIFSAENFKFMKGHTGDTSGTPIPLAASNDEAGKFTVTRHDSGAETIRTGGDNNSSTGFNAQDATEGNLYVETVSYWTGFDIGSLWFMVYNKDAYEANKSSYSTESTLNAIPNSPFKQAYTAAKTKQTEVAESTDTSEDFIAARNALNAAIAKAAVARFGKAGVNIPEIIAELTKAVDDLTMNPTSFDAVKANGDAFITTFGLTGSEAANAWATASAVEEEKKTQTAVYALEDAYSALLAAYSRIANNLSVVFKSAKDGEHYLTPTNNLSMLCSDENVNTDKRTFTIHHANSNGFYLFNEYTNKYVQSREGQSQQANLVADRNEATVYSFKGYDPQTAPAKYLIAAYGHTGKTEMLHSDGYDAVVNWDGTTLNSAWTFSFVEEEQAANEHLAGAKAFYNSCTPQGTAFGEYIVADPVAAEAALNVGSDATVEEKRAAAAALLAVTPGGTGHFYRFKGVNDSPKFLSSTEVGNRLQVIAEEATPNKLETVWYYDGLHLVSLSNGKVLNQCTSSNYHTVLITDVAAATVKFETASTSGAYAIHVSDNDGTSRYIYNQNAQGNLDAGGSDGGAGYHWSIVPVEWLPIPGSDQESTTLTSPVALALKPHINAYTATVSENGKVVLAAVEGNVIPADTPVVLYFEPSCERGGNGLVYLQIVDDVNAITPNDLKGESTTKPQVEGTNYAVFNGSKFSTPAAGANLPGFKAHLEVSDDNDHALTTTVIEDILNNGKVYTIKNEDTGNNRGYLIHDANQNCIWTTNKAGLGNDEADAAASTNADYHWTVVSDNDGKHYFYNLGAQKFASAFMQPGRSNAGTAEFCWSFSDVPTAIDIQVIDWAPSANIVQIIGGQNSNNTSRPAGMMVINGNTCPVPVFCGDNPKDGNGFIFTEVADVTAEGVPTAADIETVKTQMVGEYDAAKTNIANWNEEVASNVGYFTGEGFSAYSEKINAVEESADAEAKHYAVVRAQIAAGDNINKFAADAVYNITNADGQYYRATLTKGEDNTYTTAAIADGNFVSTEIAYNWRAAVDEAGAVSLSHVFQTAAAAAPASRAAANLEDHVCYLVENATPAYDGFGNVTLGENMVVNAITRTDNPETTAIEELSLDSKAGADVIYDLQGRRVSKAANGVYIVNGKKVYVK